MPPGAHHGQDILQDVTEEFSRKCPQPFREGLLTNLDRPRPEQPFRFHHAQRFIDGSKLSPDQTQH